MIDHTGLNVSDLVRSSAFYEAALAPLGYVILRRIGEVAVGLGHHLMPPPRNVARAETSGSA